MSTSPKIAIVGGGPAALLMAIALARRGLATQLYERDAHPNVAPRFNPDRSYTIDITGHGIRALRYIDATATFDDTLIPFKGIRALGRMTEEQAEIGWTGSRGDILRALMSIIETHHMDKIACNFGTPVQAVDVHAGSIAYTSGDGESRTAYFDLVIGGDGAGSMVRSAMETQVGGFEVVRASLPNYCTMLELDRVGTALDPHYLHILSARPPCVAGAINGPNGPTDPRWFCMVAASESRVFDSVDEVRAHFRLSPHVLEMASDDAIAAFAHRKCQHIGRKLTCSQLFGGKAVLLGDAAAPFPPIGQGVNAALESATVLDQCIGDIGPLPDGFPEAIRRYNDAWKPEADAVSWVSEKMMFDNPLHLLRGAIATQFGVSVFGQAKRGDKSYAQVRRDAEKLWPLWV
jgi:2-polyprenyl-6-methoxyphenol hydroxylase-like FAD-dependent oxidoreductase